MLGVFKINFMDMTFIFRSIKFPVFVSLFPFETGSRKRLTHCPSVDIVCIVIHNTVVVFFLITICSMRIVGFCMPF